MIVTPTASNIEFGKELFGALDMLTLEIRIDRIHVVTP